MEALAYHASLDHSVSTGDQPIRYCEAELFGRLEVDDQFPMGFLKKRHLCRVTAIENFNNLRGDAPSPRSMDDNDNRLFGVTAEIMWVPKPAYLLTLRTPLYFVRNYLTASMA